MSCLFSCVTSANNTVKYRKSISFRTLLPMLTASIAMRLLAFRFSVSLPEKQLKMMLGLVLIGLSVFLLFSARGPPVVLYLVHATVDKTVYFATIQLNFAATNNYVIAVRAVEGIIT